MATLSGNKIKDTYQSLIKLTDNGNLTTGAKQLTDGFGNNSPLYISTTQIGIGVTPEATYDLHVYSNAKVGGNLTVTGDLTVEGTTTTIDTQTLTVEDPLIEVASNNTSTDAVDIGWYGKYAPSGTVLYAGLFRDTGDSKFKLFRNLEEQPTTTVNTSGTGYTVATLVANLEGNVTGDITGNADTATALETARTIQVSGDIAGSASFDGTADINISTTIQPNSVALGTDTTGNYVATISGTANEITVSDSGSESAAVTISLPSSISVDVTGDLTGDVYNADGSIILNTGDNSIDAVLSNGVRATTQTQGDNSTKLATTAYVDSAIGGQDTLAEILANGNTTGGTDIDVSVGDSINFAGSGSTSTVIEHDIYDTRIINDNSLGGIILRSATTVMQNAAGTETSAFFREDGAVELYYDNSKKFETTTNGVEVTGTLIDLDSSANATVAIDRGGTSNDAIVSWRNAGSEYFKAGLDSTNNDLWSLLHTCGSGLYFDGLNMSFGMGTDTPKGTLTLNTSGTFTTDSNDNDFSAVNLVLKTSNTATNAVGSGVVWLKGGNDTRKVAAITNYTYGDTDQSGLNFYVQQTSSGSSATLSEAMRIDNSGNVGIGTTSPSHALDVTSGAYDQVQWTRTSGVSGYLYSDSAGAGIYSGASFSQAGIYLKPNISMDFRVNGSQRMFINSSGSIGIGETSLSSTRRLHIAGTQAYNTASGGNGTGGIYIKGGTAGDNNYSSGIGFSIGTGTSGISGVQTEGSDSDRMGLAFFTHGSGTGSAASSEAMRIESNGNVGIGNTNPLAKLQITSGDSGASSAWSNADELILESSGNAGLAFQTPNTGAATIAFQDPESVQAGFIQYLHADNALRFATNGNNERMRITDIGRVVIGGTTATANTLTLVGSAVEFDIHNTSGKRWRFNADTSGNLRFEDKTGGTEAMRIASNGSVGINVTSPNAGLQIALGGTSIPSAGSNTGSVCFGNTTSGSAYGLVMGANSSGVGYISSQRTDGGATTYNLAIQPNGGNVGIGLSTITDKLDVTTSASQYTGSFIYGGTNGSYGALRCTLSASNSPSFIDFYRTSYSTTNPVGAIVTGGTNVLYQSYSDYRLKENISDLTGALDRVNNLQPKTFNYINAPETTNEGFIAHELQEVVPQAVSGERDGTNEDGTPKYQGVDNAHIVPLLVGAIKEQQAIIEDLKSRIEILENN